MKNWKKYFRELILQRGFDYYQNGAITFLESTEDGYRAIVEGSEEYEVEILLFDNKIEELLCTCPYAEDGKACKHLAAVFYQIEADGVKKAEAEKQLPNSEQ